MRVIVLVKATEDSEAGAMPSAELLEAMGRFNEELADARSRLEVDMEAVGVGVGVVVQLHGSGPWYQTQGQPRVRPRTVFAGASGRSSERQHVPREGVELPARLRPHSGREACSRIRRS